MNGIEFLSDSAKLYQNTVMPVCKKYGLTYMEFSVLMFLYNNPQYNTAAQVVAMRHIAKSHVSVSVNSLMEKGLLSGEKCPDKRITRLSVTESGASVAKNGRAAQEEFVEILCSGFSARERETFLILLNKMGANVADYFNVKRSGYSG